MPHQAFTPYNTKLEFKKNLAIWFINRFIFSLPETQRLQVNGTFVGSETKNSGINLLEVASLCRLVQQGSKPICYLTISYISGC